MALEQYRHSHVIEYHFTCQALFNDDRKHVIRYDFMPPSPETSVFDYRKHSANPVLKITKYLCESSEILQGYS